MKSYFFALLLSLSFAAQGQANKKVLVMVVDGFNADEFWRPYFLLKGAGVAITVASLNAGRVEAGSKSRELDVLATLSLQEVNPAQFDALFIPGGKSPGVLVNYPESINLIKKFGSQKPIAAICHGPLLLAKAGLLHGKMSTYLPEVKYESGADLNPGDLGVYLDQPVVLSENLIMSRYPDDAEAFAGAFLRQLYPRRKSNDTASSIALYGKFQDPKSQYAFRRGSLAALNIKSSFQNSFEKQQRANYHVVQKENPSPAWIKDTLTPFCKSNSGKKFLISAQTFSSTWFTSISSYEALFEYLMQTEGIWLADLKPKSASAKSASLIVVSGFNDWEYQTVRTLLDAAGFSIQCLSPKGGNITGEHGLVVETQPIGTKVNTSFNVILDGDSNQLENLSKLVSSQVAHAHVVLLGRAVMHYLPGQNATENITISAPDPLKWSFPKNTRWTNAAFTLTKPGIYTVKDVSGLGQLLFSEFK